MDRSLFREPPFVCVGVDAMRFRVRANSEGTRDHRRQAIALLRVFQLESPPVPTLGDACVCEQGTSGQPLVHADEGPRSTTERSEDAAGIRPASWKTLLFQACPKIPGSEIWKITVFYVVLVRGEGCGDVIAAKNRATGTGRSHTISSTLLQIHAEVIHELRLGRESATTACEWEQPLVV